MLMSMPSHPALFDYCQKLQRNVEGYNVSLHLEDVKDFDRELLFNTSQVFTTVLNTDTGGFLVLPSFARVI
jgi:hypothetical protein